MKRDVVPHLQPQNKERNERIASILTLIMTVSAKIQKIKEKLCGFSSHDFSPEIIFEALDLTNKGYLDLFDVKEFLSNDRIQDQDIIKFFIRFGKKDEQKMTYLSYLNFLKPQFNQQLGRDLLMRDTIKKSTEKISSEQQEAVLLLLRQLFLLNCICVAQHQDIKGALMDEYMLNSLQIKQIIGLDGSSPTRAIYEFIDCNSQYAVEQEQIKYLLAYLRVPDYELSLESTISSLFIPVRLDMKQVYSKKQTVSPDFLDRQRQKLHMNYNKKYLGKNDLSSTSQKLSFLNFIHPNSYEHPPPVKDVPVNLRVQRQSKLQNEDMIASQNYGLKYVDEGKFKKSFSRVQQKEVQQTERLNPTQIARKLINSSDVPIHTPVLEQFMHASNLHQNRGDFNTQRQVNKGKDQQLNVLLEQSAFSHMSNSQAFQRIPKGQHHRINMFQDKGSVFNKSNIPQEEKSALHANRYPKGLEVVSNQMDVSSGILNQFMRV